jgi:uncharacterized protein (TIGR03437 family)
LNANITNTLDDDGNPKNITVTASGAAITSNPPVLTSASSLLIASLSYTVPTPNTIPVTITISGIRAAVALAPATQGGAVVNASLVGVGFTVSPPVVPVALGFSTLLGAVQNNGVNCNGSPLPATTDFPGFVSGGTSSSAVRITEALTGSFTPGNPGVSSGTRIIVRFAGYPSGAQLWVPDAIVGNSGSVPTSAGQFATSIAGGTYTPSANQLLLSLVSGADQNGAGGTLKTPLPSGGLSFSSMTQLALSDGTAFAVYEVLDASPYVTESFQAPVFIVNSQTNCNVPAQATLSAVEGPVSTVSIATKTDPVPRYQAAPIGYDCQQTGDCGQVYFPVLSVDTTPIALSGFAQGLVQTSLLPVLNNGGSFMSYTTTIQYQSGSGWLSISPSFADVRGSLQLKLAADPTALQSGTYAATITIDAGQAGNAKIPVTFTVGAPGVTIRAIVNAASFQPAISPGSYVALYGQLLAGSNISVTFNNVPAIVIPVPAPYNQTQINLIVPSSLNPQSGANVIVTVDGKASNTFSATLTANAPGIFTPGIVNADGSINSASHPAPRGAYVQVYLTGLAIPVTGIVSVTIGNQNGILPLYAGAQPTLPALDQVNVTLPASVPSGSTQLSVCVATLPSTPSTCSNSVNLYVQ